MNTRKQWIKRRALALAVAAVGVVAIAGTALAGHQTSGVKSYTGCLVSGDGVMIKIKEGNAPRSACTGGQVEAHFSGGDITKISVGSGLSLPNGGDNGEVRIELAAGQALPQGCADGRVAEWDSGPSRWICGVDNDTTYDDGTGLDLSASNVFSINPDYRVKNTPDCPSGQFATGFEDNGTIRCSAPTSSGVEVWQKAVPGGVGDSFDLPDGEGVDLVSMQLPAGTFLITAVATVRDGNNGNDEVRAECSLRNGASAILPVGDGFVDIGQGQDFPGAATILHGLLVLAASDTVRFTCFGEGDDNRAQDVTLTAIKVGTVHTP